MTEYVGVGELSKFQNIVETTGAKKVFLVTGTASYTASGAKEYFDNLSGIELYVHDDFGTVVTPEDIQKGVGLCNKFDPDLVVGVGGGHVLDIAKAIGALSTQEDSLDLYLSGAKKLQAQGKPVLAIPTTAGSGSETTHFAVVYKDGVKYSLAGEQVLPRYVIVDPALSFSMPKQVAIASALDALSQSIESFWAKNATEESKAYSRQALRTVWENIIPAVEGKDEQSMIAMSLAAHEAGKAINLAQTTACHALSYGLTTRFHIPHGIAVATLLPAVYRFNSKTFSTELFKDLSDVLGTDGAKALSRLLSELGVSGLASYGVGDSDIRSLAGGVNAERLSNNPRSMSEQDIISIYTEVL